MLATEHGTKEYLMLFAGAVAAGVLLYLVELYVLPPVEKFAGITA